MPLYWDLVLRDLMSLLIYSWTEVTSKGLSGSARAVSLVPYLVNLSSGLVCDIWLLQEGFREE